MRHWSKSPEYPDAAIETAWAAEAHRRWKAYQRGEEGMLSFEDVMAEIREGSSGHEGHRALTVDHLESELRNQPRDVRAYLVEVLNSLESEDLDDDAVEAEAHRRATEMVRGVIEGIDGDEVIAGLRARPR